ncbi:hypothetical protein ACFQRK_22895 [Parapedobacter sp. GCM10030251]|uniref:hypothetical protein n=1 Tax=Parapedobacter sp. GCM10030251 TaxID=3273419 RepID=UPI003617E626
MRSLILLIAVLSFFWQNEVVGQTSVSASTDGAGWKRIARVSGVSGRGFGTVSIYTEGGSYQPVAATVTWFHDWSNKAGVSVQSDSQNSPYWTAVRITDDGLNTSSYIEVNFTRALSKVLILSDDYGWGVATPYAGALPAGTGTVRATANIGRLNIENKFMVGYDGKVGIGTATPQAELAVNGTILTKEVKVKTDISVPDYVFEPDYKLSTLAEIEAYVRQHKHLPEIPSAKDIEQDGLNLAEMNLLLLKKVEELTLHLIEVTKRLEQVESNNKELTAK